MKKVLYLVIIFIFCLVSCKPKHFVKKSNKAHYRPGYKSKGYWY